MKDFYLNVGHAVQGAPVRRFVGVTHLPMPVVGFALF